MLALEIEWLMGVAFLARDPSSAEPDWPPQPDRVFSALVASWGARGSSDDERDALRWLESQAPPQLAAARPERRTVVTVFVPPNDPSGQIEVLPDRRRRQPRLFPAVRLPEDAPDHVPVHLRLTWDMAPEAPVLERLSRLAQDTSYLGHSSSLVRCRFTGESKAGEGLEAEQTERAPYAGRLNELEALFARHTAGDERARPKRSASLSAAKKRDEPSVPSSVFSPNWTVLAHAGGGRPDLLAAAGVARHLRDALMSVWPEQPVPAWLSGHAADGSPSRDAHLAIAPLANIGFDHSDGRLMGLALIPPRAVVERWSDGSPQAWREKRALRLALTALANMERERVEAEGKEPPAEPLIRILLGSAGTWTLVPDEERRAASMRPERYCRPAMRFATATPIALDQHPKANGPERLAEAAEIVADSCERIGLPRPVSVRAYKHAALQGAPSAWPAGGSPKWGNWARPKSLNGRPLVHALIEFGERVEGPVILGAGRFFGLGLCLPLPDDDR